MKILIAADMEGISGVVHWNHTDSSHAEYARFRKLMTADVNAAVEGAFEGGADEITVSDGHGGGTNILIEDLDARARLNSGSPSPFAMIQGIDNDVNAAFFVGYHARAGTPNAIMDHTWSGAVASVWLNGVPVGEIGVNAAVCGHFGAPVLMVSGCRTACAEAADLLGNIETAPVKDASGRIAADCLAPEVARTAIKAAAARAVERLKAGEAPPPWRVETPVEIAVEFKDSLLADGASVLPGAHREGLRISCTVADMPDAYRAFRALVSLA